MYKLISRYIRVKIRFNYRQLFTLGRWYTAWIERNESYNKQEVLKEVDSWENKPLISILLPVFNSDEKQLRECIDSVVNQYYPNWELCIADDNSVIEHVNNVIESYRLSYPNIKVIYRNENGHISACTNTALSLAKGEYTAFLDHDDLLAPHALYEVVKEINLYPGVDMIFSNEDKIINDKRCYPFFKKKWDREILLNINYICHLSVYKTSFLKNTLKGLRLGYEGVQDWDLALRAFQLTDRVIHIPKILYHWRVTEYSTSSSENKKPYIKAAKERLSVNKTESAIGDYYEN